MVNLFLIVKYLDGSDFYKVLDIVRVESVAKEIAEDLGCNYITQEVKPLSVGRNPHKKSKYPFHTMNIGDNFPIHKFQILSMRSYACEVGRHTGMKFSVSGKSLTVTRIL